MADNPRRRLRFDSVVNETTPDGHCRVTVRLEWYDRMYESEVDGLQTHHGLLRAAASAALTSALQAAGPRLHAELAGVKAVRAFDGWVVVVRLKGQSGNEPLTLLGASSCEEETELPRATVQAVLDATNRVLEGALQARS
jgi:hypothetical protein